MANELNGSTQSELSTDLSTLTAEINAYKRIAGEAIFEIGRRLKHVKENDLAHGEWTKWCKESLEFTERNAQRYMKVFDKFESKTTHVSHLPFGSLSLLTSFTDEELEQEYELPSGETKKPTEMSRREIEDLKRQLKSEKQARESVESDNRKLAQSLTEERNKPPEVRYETRTEYVKPDDYEELRIENEHLRSKYGQGLRRNNEKERGDFYREFAEDLEYIRNKYGSIVLDGDKLREFVDRNKSVGERIDNFDEFWNQFSRSVFKNQTIIEMESV